MKRYILFLLITFAISSVGTAHAYEYSPYAADTLQRELTLQKEYVPIGHQAERTTFNPLDTRGKASLTPIEFAKNTYQVGMNVTPKLFQPIQNPLAPEYPKQLLHARLFGGYPLYAGGNISFRSKVGESGSILLRVDHVSRVNKTSRGVTPFEPQNTTHDSEVGLNYTHALPDRLLNIGAEVFNHFNSYYGHSSIIPSQNLNRLLNGDENFQEKYNLLRLTGGEASVSISPAPLSLLSGWQYSARANVGIANKQDPFYMDQVSPIISYKGDGSAMNERNTLSELNLRVQGNLGYHFAGTDWGTGLDGSYQLLSISQLKVSEDLNPAQVLSLDPYLQYNSPTFMIKAGAKLQLLNRGKDSFLVTPDVELRWKTSPLLSLYAIADGGAEYSGLRKLYNENRYADAGSVYTGYNITKYRALLGMQLGNFNGFSMDIYGGYADHLSFADWQINAHQAPTHPDMSHDPFNVITFRKSDRGGVHHTFFSATANYISYFGLDLSASIQYNKYSRKESEEKSLTYPIEGLPSTELSLSADYAINDKLSAGMCINGMGGIKFNQMVDDAANEIKLPFIHELDARISYKVHKHIGLSLIGKNILNNKSERWAYYERPGGTILGVLTITL